MEMSFSPVACMTSGTERLAENTFLWSIIVEWPYSSRFSLLLVFLIEVQGDFFKWTPICLENRFLPDFCLLFLSFSLVY